MHLFTLQPKVIALFILLLEEAFKKKKSFHKTKERHSGIKIDVNEVKLSEFVGLQLNDWVAGECWFDYGCQLSISPHFDFLNAQCK